MIQLAISDNQVLVGLANEKIYTGPLQINDNSNVQNYIDNEYTSFNYKQKGLLRLRIREFKENEIQFYDIWTLQYYKQKIRIYKINPYLNYKDDVILEINDFDYFCLDFYIIKQQLILDCSDHRWQNITFFELNLDSNQSSQQNFNFNYQIQTDRKIYFHEMLIIILIKEVKNHIISIYNRTLLMEIKSFNNQDFKLSELKVKQIIFKTDKMLISTLCQKLFLVDQYEPYLIQQICEDHLIDDIQDNFDKGFFVFEQYNIFLLTDLQYCISTQSLLQQTRFRLFKQSGLLYKYNPNDQQISKIKSCPKNSVEYFSYFQQLIICKDSDLIKFNIFTDQLFSKVTMTNNFYQTQDKTLITRIINPGDIEYIDIQEDFFPLVYAQSEQNLIIKYNILFHGPNITYNFKSKEFVHLQNQFIIEKERKDIQCYFYDFYRILDQFNNYAYLCQFENKTVQISAIMMSYTPQNKLIILNYQLDLYLDESYLIISTDSEKLCVMKLDNQQSYEFKQLNQFSNNMSFTVLYFHNLYFQLINDTIIQFRWKIQEEIFFTLALDKIKSLGIDQTVNFIYLSTNKQYLFLGTENNVIIFNIVTTSNDNVKFQVVQVIENQLQIQQVYLSNEVLYLIYSDNGFLKIIKYQILQYQHFSYVGEVDCLGYKVEKFDLNRNGAIEYYFINSYQDTLVFQLQKSLQNSFIRAIHNSKFIRSLDHKFCLSSMQKITCYGIYNDRFQIQLNFDLIKHSQSIPYEVCASNLKSIKCLNQSLQVLINYQNLIINNYYLTHINQDIYSINFDIQQGFINKIKGDENLELIQPMKLIINQTSNIIQIQEYGNIILMNSNKDILFYNKQLKQFYQLTDVCSQAFLIQNHLMCYYSYYFVKIYNCEDYENCILQHQQNIKNRVISQVKYSGNIILLKQIQSIEIVYYNPVSGKFMRRITLIETSQYVLIQNIRGYDFWYIYLNEENLYLLKYLQFEQQLNKTIKIYEQFNKDKQFTSKQDQIIEILVLDYNQNSITVLFLLKQSTHKAYKFQLINEIVEVQCIFELLFYRQQDHNEKYRYSLNNDILLIQIDQEKLGVFNVSLNQKVFLRNMQYILQLNFSLSISLIRNIHHFIEENQIFLLISQNSKLYLFELNFQYQLRILDVKKQSIIKLNEDKENIQILIPQRIEQDSYQYYKIAFIVIVILIIVYIFRRQFIKRNI